MENFHISPSSESFRALEARLDVGDLSLGDIREIEDGVLIRSKDLTQKAAGRIFDKIGKKREGLLDKEAVRLDQLGDVASKVSKLVLFKSALNPGEIEDQISSIQKEAKEIKGNPEVAEAVKRQLAHLRFAESYPIVGDLADSYESNFRSRMETMRNSILTGNSVAPFSDLSPLQQKEIRFFAERGGA